MNVYQRYAPGKTQADYYHAYTMNVPWGLWRLLGTAAHDKEIAISQLVRGYVLRGLRNDGYDVDNLVFI